MPNINLIAARREEKKKIERLTRQLFVGLLGSVGILVTVILYVGARQVAAHASLAGAERRWATVKPKLEEIEKLNQAKDALMPKVETLEQAQRETYRWRAVMQAISASIPEDAWISTMATAGAAEDMTINLTGIAANKTIIGETYRRLGRQPIFDGVELRSSKEVPRTPGETVTRFSFDLGVHLRPAPKPEETKGPAQNAQAGAGEAGKNNG
ncbi:MAG: PilN domain-containing protein [Capsulimonadales bacterium]|nr:PilN domain-containing protein [Capsulimonadales bacterium]